MWFKEACIEAGILNKSAHGLRKAAATRAAEKGATAQERERPRVPPIEDVAALACDNATDWLSNICSYRAKRLWKSRARTRNW